MMQIPGSLTESRWQREFAASAVDPLPETTIDAPENRPDPSATIDGWIRGACEVEDAFVRLAHPLVLALQRLTRDRPQVMERAFDLVNDGGRLRVIDADISESDRDWLEQELDRDGELGRLADAFNRQVVRTYDTEHGNRDKDGVLLARTGFLADGMALIDYAGLQGSVDASVKFRSLLRDVTSAESSSPTQEGNRYRLGGRLVQNYIVGEITQYVVRPDGTGEVQSRRGSILRNDLWA